MPKDYEGTGGIQKLLLFPKIVSEHLDLLRLFIFLIYFIFSIFFSPGEKQRGGEAGSEKALPHENGHAAIPAPSVLPPFRI